MRMMWERVKSLSSVRIYYIVCSLLIHPATHSIMEGNQIDQAWFPSGKPMLTVPNYLFVLYIFLEMDSMRTFSMIFPGSKMRLID